MNQGPRYATLSDYLLVVRRNRLLILGITLAFAIAAYALSKSQEPVYVASTSISFRDVSQDAAPIGEDIIPTVAAAERAAREAELIARPEITKRVKKRLEGVRGGTGAGSTESESNASESRGDEQAGGDQSSDEQASDGKASDEQSGSEESSNGEEEPNETETPAAETSAEESSTGAQLSEDELADAVTAGVDIRTNLVTLEAESSDAELAARIANAFAEEIRIDGDKDLDRLLDKAAQRIEEDIEVVREGPENGPDLIELSALRQRLNGIELLKLVAEPVVINRRATAPESPESPKPARNTVIGLLIGLIFALLAAFVRSSLDRKVHTPHDVHDELGLPILGRVPEKALGYAGLAKNGRLAMPESDFEAFRMLRMNLGFLEPEDGQLRSVLVTSGGPEEGKTSVSLSLASAAALAGQRVLLVEADLRRPTIATRTGLAPAPGLTDYLQGNAGPAEILQTIDLDAPSLATPAKNGSESDSPSAQMVVITAGTQASTPAELLAGERFTAFIEKVTTAYDLVVIDTSPLLAVVDPVEIAPHVDGVLVCVRVRRTTRDQVRATRATLSMVGESAMGAVATGIKRGDRESGDYYYGY